MKHLFMGPEFPNNFQEVCWKELSNLVLIKGVHFPEGKSPFKPTKISVYISKSMEA